MTFVGLHRLLIILEFTKVRFGVTHPATDERCAFPAAGA
jgi:hypothetical protein